MYRDYIDNCQRSLLSSTRDVKSTSPDTANHDKNDYVKLHNDKNIIMTNEDNNHDTNYTIHNDTNHHDARELHKWAQQHAVSRVYCWRQSIVTDVVCNDTSKDPFLQCPQFSGIHIQLISEYMWEHWQQLN